MIQHEDKIIEAIENCIGQPKCADCPWEACEQEHEVVNSVPYGLLRDAVQLIKEQAQQIERLERDLAVTENNLNYYVNGND